MLPLFRGIDAPYSLRNNTSDNMIQNNWYNSGGASTPNAAAHNNKLINNVKISGANWPAGARDVICAAGVAPQYRTSLNANQFGFTGCAVDAPVASGFATAKASAVSSYFGQSGGPFGIAANGVVFEWDANGDGYWTPRLASVDSYRPVWVKLARSGTSFNASYSYDGKNYAPVGAPVTLASAAARQDAGIFSTSHDVNQSAINQFDSVAFAG